MNALESMVPGACEARPLDINDALMLGLQLQRLQSVDTYPGSRHKAFLTEMRGRLPDQMSENERAQIRRLAWRYRWQLPAMLRPAADPDQETNQEKSFGS
jgi:hypothetical protein